MIHQMETPPTVKKTLVSSSTKTSLTPCRRMGLGRPASGSLKRTILVRGVGTPVPQNVQSIADTKTPTDCEGKSKVPLESSNAQDKSAALRAKRCLNKISSRTKMNMSPSLSVGISDIHNDTLTPRLEVGLVKSLSGEEKTHDKRRKLDFSLNCEVRSHDDPSRTEHSFIPAVFNDLNECDDKTSKRDHEMIQQLALSIKEKKKKLELLKVQKMYAKKHDLADLRIQTAKWKAAGCEALRYSVSLARDAGHSVSLKQLMTQHGFPPHLMGYNSEDDEFD